jgi:hypothetical protein
LKADVVKGAKVKMLLIKKIKPASRDSQNMAFELTELLFELALTLEIDPHFFGDSHKFGATSELRTHAPYRDQEFDFSATWFSPFTRRIQELMYLLLPHMPKEATQSCALFF